jgi:hypothetical protein
MTTTLSAMQAGSFAMKWVVAIEGVQYLLTDASIAAVQAAYAGTSYDDGGVSVLQGLTVDLKNQQSLNPWSPFVSAGRCNVRLQDVSADQSDTFGILVHRRNAGTETELAATVNRSATTITVKSTSGFASSGYVYIGTECIKYTGTTGTSFTGCTRGMFSPFETGPGGSGGARFANHHRKGQDVNHVQTAPLVTQLPRTWIGKRVSVRLHLWDPQTDTINTRDEAQLVFAGRLVGIADEPARLSTVLELEHASKEIETAIVGRDFFTAEIPKGMWIAAGRVFRITDVNDGTTRTSNDLTVVTSGAAGANQMNQGFYTGPEMCEKLNTWLASEKVAARVWGNYHWRTPVSNADGVRTVCDWRISNASSGKHVNFALSMPGEVMSFLGLRDVEPSPDAALQVVVGGAGKYSNIAYQRAGNAVPFSTVVFRPSGPGRIAQEFSESITYELENERGVILDNREWLPASIKNYMPAGHVYGVFILDERVTMIGAYDSTNGYLQNCYLAPFQLVSDDSNEPMTYIGRRVDEPDEPVKIRQIFLIDATLANAIRLLIYSTGTPGYNHSTYDSLGYGIGIGAPGELFGNEFDRSLSNLPGANAPIMLVLEEPKKLGEILEGDLLFRNAFVRWKDQHFEFAQWKTPMLADSVATFNEETKAAPAGQKEDHRVASQESDFEVRPVIKVEYGRDFASTRGKDTYLKTLWFEDQTTVDDGGNNEKPRTISLRNTYSQFAAAGSAVEAIVPNFIASLTLRTRSQRRIVRSLALKYWEGYSVGDCVTVVDTYARDPITGRRGISSRAAIITRMWYSPGDKLSGEVELMFLDAHRGELYAPSAQVDETASAGGFTSGYNSGTNTLRTYDRKFSHALSLLVFRGRGVAGVLDINETTDAQRFVATDKVLIIEIDPADPLNPLYWERTIASVSGTDITLTAGLSAPAFDSTKKYRITYQKYSQVTALQQDYSFQADETTCLIEGVDPPDHFCVTDEQYSFTANTGNEKGELIPEMLYGSGRPWDVGTDRALINSVNQYLDRKSAHQSPLLWNQPEFGTSNPTYVPVWMGPVFFGTEQLSTAIYRLLTIAPFMRSNTAGLTGYIRATLSRSIPTAQPGGTPSLQATAGVRFVDHYSQVATEWSTSSATYAVMPDRTLEIAVKDMTYGYAWLVIERKGPAEIRGLSKFIEGVRVVV